MLKLALPALLCLVGCYSPNVPDGKLKCSTSGNKCPDGYHCATDGTCWKNGHDPMANVDMAGPPRDMASLDLLTTPADLAQTPPDMYSLPPHVGTSVVSGAVTAHSEHYKMIMSTGQPPGGNTSASSTNFKKRGGVAGATQGK